jgi:hypothetical protein
MKICFRCLKEVAIKAPPTRNDVCPFCRADLRCCINCAFYDERSYNQCREPQAERVLEKERSNFCDYFRFNESTTEPDGTKTAFVRDKLEALFNKK